MVSADDVADAGVGKERFVSRPLLCLLVMGSLLGLAFATYAFVTSQSARRRESERAHLRLVAAFQQVLDETQADLLRFGLAVPPGALSEVALKLLRSRPPVRAERYEFIEFPVPGSSERPTSRLIGPTVLQDGTGYAPLFRAIGEEAAVRNEMVAMIRPGSFSNDAEGTSLLVASSVETEKGDLSGDAPRCVIIGSYRTADLLRAAMGVESTAAVPIHRAALRDLTHRDAPIALGFVGSDVSDATATYRHPLQVGDLKLELALELGETESSTPDQRSVVSIGTLAGFLVLSLTAFLVDARRRKIDVARSRRLHAGSRELLAEVVDAVPHMIVGKDHEGHVVLSNVTTSEAFGVPTHSLRKRRLEEFVPLGVDPVRAARTDREVIQSGQAVRIQEEAFLDAEGRQRILQTTKIPFRPDRYSDLGVLAVSVDITELKEVQRALSAAHDELNRVLSEVSDVLWSARLEPNGSVSTVYFSPAVERLTGLPPDAFNDGFACWIALVHEEDAPKIARRFIGTLDADAMELEYRILRPDGRERWVRDQVRLTDRDDGCRLFGVITDITEHRRTEDEQRRLEEKVRQSQKLECLGVLAGGIAHDFNNMLTGMMGNASLALSELREPAARSYIEGVLKGARRAADLCRQMLAYSGRGRFMVERVNLNATLDDMVGLLEVSVSKKIALEFERSPGLPTVDVDVTQVRQVIMNLITNASESIGERGGSVVVRTGIEQCNRRALERSRVSAEDVEPGEFVYFEVEDTGGGMTPEVLDRIFDPFFTTKFTGRGLGLAAVLGIVRGHRGAIFVESDVGVGTRFRVLFPPGTEQAKTSVFVPATADRTLTGDGRLVLVVDDEDAVRDVASDMLRRLGFQVVTARDGREGVFKFKQVASSVKCVLLDLTMPGMDGQEAYREIRRVSADTYVILTSGYTLQDALGGLEDRDHVTFLKKPFGQEELVAALTGMGTRSEAYER